MKIQFKTKHPGKMMSLLGRVVEDRDVLSDEGSNLHRCLIMPFNMCKLIDGNFVGTLYFRKVNLPSTYDKVSIVALIERIRTNEYHCNKC